MSQAVIGKAKGRKPVDMGIESSQDVIWTGVRTLGAFTQDELTIWIFNQGHKAINDATVKSYLDRLRLGGYLNVEVETVSNTMCKYHYTLLKNTGVETPRLSKKGKPVTQGRGRENLWRTMRVLNDFNFRELAAAASTEEQPVTEVASSDYVKHLCKAGYLHQISKSNKNGKLARYRLMPGRYTGPKPPQIQRTKQIYDPNLGEVVWSSHPLQTEEAN